MARQRKGLGGRLTRQQEIFVQALVSGNGPSEAYRIAYPKSNNWTPQSVATEARRLSRKPHVAARIEELEARYQKHLEFSAIYSLEDLLYDFLYLKERSEESIDEVGVRQANSNAYINSLKNIGELLSLYPDKKVDLKANISSDFEINILGDGGNGAEGEVDAIEGTCEEVDDVLELDEPAIELDLIFPKVGDECELPKADEHDEEADLGGEPSGGAKD